MRIIQLLSLLSLMVLQANAQNIIVADASTEKPVAFALVSAIGSSESVLANELGVANLGQFNQIDSVYIRAIGYYAAAFAISSHLQDEQRVFLIPSMLHLDEVIVRPQKPEQYLLEALKKVSENFIPDSFYSAHYYQEILKENSRYLNMCEAFLHARCPGYFTARDSFDIEITACRKADGAQLNFMQKEQEKEIKKEIKAARKEGRELDEEDLAIPLELGSPLIMLMIDPLRQLDNGIHVNGQSVNFLDSASFHEYEFIYGKPEAFGDKTLVTINFDQQERVKKPLFKGTIWIEQESSAIVKIAFGLSKRGEKHLLPAYTKAALWLYGLSYEIEHTLMEFEYRPFGSKWAHSASRLKASFYLEKRRFFDDNDSGNFVYTCEMLTTKHADKPLTAGNRTPFDPNKALSRQRVDVSDAKWNSLIQSARNMQ